MKTIERPETIAREASRIHDPGPSRWPLAAIVAVIAMLIGGGLGWMLRDTGTGDVVLAGDGDLTSRQEQIVDFLDDYQQAWNDGDVDALLAMFVPTGRFVGFDTTYRVDDGTLAAFVADGWAIDGLRPTLVNGDRVISFHVWNGDTYIDTMQFTGTGELLLLEHTVTD